MPSPASHPSPSEGPDLVRVVLGPSLHRAYDPVLQEPLPEELLIAGGIGPAWRDASGEE